MHNKYFMFTIYSKPNCTFCDQAKALLKSRGLSYTEIHVDVGQPQVEGNTYVSVAQLKEKVPTAKTVPQILREDGSLVGGFTELKKELTIDARYFLASMHLER